MLDASVFISAILKQDSIPARAVLLALSPGSTLAISPDIEAEYREVLDRPKFDRWVSAARRQEYFDAVLFAAARFQPRLEVRDCPDPKDNRYLTLALECDATAIISSDEKHLLPCRHGEAFGSCGQQSSSPSLRPIRGSDAVARSWRPHRAHATAPRPRRDPIVTTPEDPNV